MTNKENKKKYWVVADYVYNIFGKNEHIVIYLMHGKKDNPKYISEKVIPAAGRWRQEPAHAHAKQHIEFLVNAYDADILKNRTRVDV